MTDSQHPDTVAKQTAAAMSVGGWEKMRAVALGAGGACVAILLFVLQDSQLRQSCLTALTFACIGLPSLLAAAFMVENYLSHGESSYKSLKYPSTFWAMGAAFFSGGACLIASFFFLLHPFFPAIAWLFLAACAASLILVMWHNAASKPNV